jgi:hypothetical protein
MANLDNIQNFVQQAQKLSEDILLNFTQDVFNYVDYSEANKAIVRFHTMELVKIMVFKNDIVKTNLIEVLKAKDDQAYKNYRAFLAFYHAQDYQHSLFQSVIINHLKKFHQVEGKSFTFDVDNKNEIIKEWLGEALFKKYSSL